MPLYRWSSWFGGLPIAFALAFAPASAQNAAPSTADVLRAAAAALGTLPASGALHTRGTIAQSGQNGTFTSWLDFSHGYNVIHLMLGPLSGDSGYDGAAWNASNGITTVDDLPATQAQNVTQAFLLTAGWARPNPNAVISDGNTATDAGQTYRLIRMVPAGGVPATLWFDAKTHVLARTDVVTDAGTVTDRYSDYRAVSGLQVPYRDVTFDPNGSVTTTVVTDAAIGTLPDGALARTPPQERGSIAGNASQAAVPFRFSLGDTGNIVLPVAFGHNAPVQTVFDTGGRNVLTPESAQTLGLGGSGGLDVNGVGSQATRASISNVSTISAGGATLVDQQALVIPLPLGLTRMFPDQPVDGLIGFEMLYNFQTTIDYAKQVITFAPYATPLPVPVRARVIPFLSNGSTPYVYAEIDGVRGLFQLDTGNAGSLVVFKPFADAHKLFHNATSLPYVSAGGVGGTVPLRLLRAHRFTLAGTTLAAPIVELTDQKTGAFASQTLAGNIGADILHRFTLQINYRAGTIALAPNDRVGDPFVSDDTGLSLSRVANGYRVLGVTPGTPAESSGIIAGDTIVSANGTSLSSISSAAMYKLTHDPTIGKITFGIIPQGGIAPSTVTVIPRTLL
jgi:hypothetical protein